MEIIENLYDQKVTVNGNLISIKNIEDYEKNQLQTNDTFTDKWEKFNDEKEKNKLFEFQKEWFLDLYGFQSEKQLTEFLKTKKVIIDAGCGLGYKSAWFAKLSPNSIIIGIDSSKAVTIAAENYNHIPNLFFCKSDISLTGIKKNMVDFTVCDQVIMHTENPNKTFSHLTQITKHGGEFACYVYRKKALPRELLDDHFRKATFDISNDKLWEMSAQLTELGKRLSELNVKFESPDIPALGIRGGTYDIQRFIYWNFLKCFWREDWGKEVCDSTNFDWYAPSNAKRYTESDFKKLIFDNSLKIVSFHYEEACYASRMIK